MGYITAGIITIITYLTLASIFTGLVVMGTEETNPGIPSITEYKENQNTVITATQCTNETLSQFVPSAGSWECNTTYGYTATGTGTNRVFVFPIEDYNSTYINDYHIYNPDHQEFKVFLTWEQIWFSLTAGTTELQVNSDKIWLGECNRFGLICTTIAEEYTNYTGQDEINITTTYQYGPLLDGYAPVSATVESSYLSGTTPYASGYFGGVEVTGDGLSIDTVSSSSTIYHSSSLDPSNPSSLLNYVLLLLGWNPIGFPLEVNIVLFKLPIVALAILFMAWLKPIGGA